jgi:protein-S-isoprenylcysteine O-methyltransferase Ste14
MAAAALALYGVSLILTFGVRIAVQLRRTGSTGVHGLDRSAGPLGQFAGVLFVASLVMGALAPTLALLGVLEPISALDGTVGNALGLVLGVGGVVLTFGAQLAMGDAWRIGVNPEERTELVTDGPFGLVRNPIYSAMIPTVFGLVLMVPNVLAIAAIACLVIALELQVRLVEEPYLLPMGGESVAPGDLFGIWPRKSPVPTYEWGGSPHASTASSRSASSVPPGSATTRCWGGSASVASTASIEACTRWATMG